MHYGQNVVRVRMLRGNAQAVFFLVLIATFLGGCTTSKQVTARVVDDETGLPIKGAKVSIYSPSGNGGPFSSHARHEESITNTDGLATITAYQHVEWTVSAGAEYASGYIGSTKRPSGFLPIPAQSAGYSTFRKKPIFATTLERDREYDFTVRVSRTTNTLNGK